MANMLETLDWSLIQTFLAVARTGSLSAAAEETGQSQPTTGRHIRALEEALDVELFHRHPRGLRLTALGQEVLSAAQDMHAAMNRIGLLAEAEAGRLEGTVRIAASVFAAHHVLPTILARIRAAEPRIMLVLRPSDDSDNLTFREADIAVRMYRPRQLDLVARHIGDLPMGIFAARSYLDRRGRPKDTGELLQHDLVGFDRSRLIVDSMRGLGLAVGEESFSTRCDNQTAYWELVRAGCGIGFTQAHVGRSDPLVEEIDAGDIVIPPLPVWLTTHETVRQIPRVARVWSLLDAGLAALMR